MLAFHLGTHPPPNPGFSLEATYSLVHVDGVLAGDNVGNGGALRLARRLLSGGLGRHFCGRRSVFGLWVDGVRALKKNSDCSGNEFGVLVSEELFRVGFVPADRLS